MLFEAFVCHAMFLWSFCNHASVDCLALSDNLLLVYLFLVEIVISILVHMKGTARANITA